MKRVLLLLLCCLLLASALPTSATPSRPSNAVIAAVQDEISASLGVDTPGGVVAIYQEGTLLMCEPLGYANLESRVLVTPDTAFEIGGFSAFFVSVAAGILVEEGLLSTDADIAEYLPRDFMEKLSLTYPVTVQQLLYGTAGFGGRIFDLDFEKEIYGFESLAEALLADVPTQVLRPGTAASYSPFGITLAAYVIEVVSGVSYEAFVSERILAPLGMEDTLLRRTSDSILEMPAVGYLAEGECNFAAQNTVYSGLYPATGAISTARDLTRLFDFVFNGNTSLLSEEGRAALFELLLCGDVLPAAAALTAKNGLLGCDSSTGGFGVSVWFDVKAGNGGFVLTNAADSALLSLPQRFFGKTQDTSLPDGELLGKRELKKLKGYYLADGDELRSFVGQMRARENAVQIALSDDETLYFGEIRLTQIARGVFVNAEGEDEILLQFLLDEEGEVVALLDGAGGFYTPLSSLRAGTLSRLLFLALVLLLAWFFVCGFYGLFRWLSYRDEYGRREELHFYLPDMAAALFSLLVGVEVLVGLRLGVAALSSFYAAFRILILLIGIVAAALYVLAFVSSITARKIHHRIAGKAIMFVVLIFLVCFFGLTVF